MPYFKTSVVSIYVYKTLFKPDFYLKEKNIIRLRRIYATNGTTSVRPHKAYYAYA